jgi:acetyl esterase/lipase
VTENLYCTADLNLDVPGSHDDVLKEDEFFKVVGEFVTSLTLKPPKKLTVRKEKVVPQKPVIPMEDMVDIYLPVSTNKVVGDIVLIYIHGGYLLFLINSAWRCGDKGESVDVGQSLADTSLMPTVVMNHTLSVKGDPTSIHPIHVLSCGEVIKHILSTDRINRVRDWKMRKCVLIGHSSGAHLAALLVLDPVFLDLQTREMIVGIVGVQGIYDIPGIIETYGHIQMYQVCGGSLYVGFHQDGVYGGSGVVEEG